MKIGLVCPESFYFPGGIQEQVKGLYKFLKSEGHEVKILIPKYKNTEYYGEDVIFVGMTLAFETFGSKTNWTFIADNSEIDEILEREKFDILHFHSIGLIMTLQILGRSSSKNILTFHMLPEKSMSYALLSNILTYFYKENFDKVDKVTVTSKPVIGYIPKKYRRRISVVSNGIDLERFKPQNSKVEKFLDGKINILFVGRLDKRKGLDYLIKAYEQVKKMHENTRLIIVGEGYSKDEYENLVKENAIEDVVFEGYVKDEDLPKYYSTCDIFCYPSVRGESFGITLLEAMATGKPCIATDIKGCKSVFGSSKAILFVKPKSIRGLVKSMSKLIENKKLRERMGKNGVNNVKKYSWRNVGKQFLEIYKSLSTSK